MRFLALYANQESTLLNRRVNCSLTFPSISCGAIQTQASLRNHDVVIELGNLGMKLKIICYELGKVLQVTMPSTRNLQGMVRSTVEWCGVQLMRNAII